MRLITRRARSTVLRSGKKGQPSGTDANAKEICPCCNLPKSRSTIHRHLKKGAAPHVRAAKAFQRAVTSLRGRGAVVEEAERILAGEVSPEAEDEIGGGSDLELESDPAGAGGALDDEPVTYQDQDDFPVEMEIDSPSAINEDRSALSSHGEPGPEELESRVQTAAAIVNGVSAEFAAQRRRTYPVTVEDADESDEEEGEDEEGIAAGDDHDEDYEEDELFYPELTASNYLYEGFMHDLAKIGEL